MPPKALTPRQAMEAMIIENENSLTREIIKERAMQRLVLLGSTQKFDQMIGLSQAQIVYLKKMKGVLEQLLKEEEGK